MDPDDDVRSVEGPTMPVRRKHIRELAASLLREHGVTTPPVPIEDIVRRSGLKIRLEPLESDLSGFVVRRDGHGLIGVNSAHAKVRQRFTVAHELGHYLLHQNDQWHVDRSVFTRFRSDVSSKGTDPEEIEANLFAAEILLPREMLHEDMQTLKSVDVLDDDELIRFARRYNVSVQALVLRLTRLGYIEEEAG
jgi:Zn-dependent peptidase ImmA (M78 family)